MRLAHRNAARKPFNIQNSRKLFAHKGGSLFVPVQTVDLSKPLVDFRFRAQRVAYPAAQKPRAHSRSRMVYGLEKGVGGRIIPQVINKLQIFSCRIV